MKLNSQTSKVQTAESSESNQRIYDFLNNHPIGVLATVDPNANPHAAAIYFSIDKDFNLYFATKRDTKKHDNLTHKNHAMLICFDAETQTTAQVTGTAKDISNTSKAQDVFKSMLKAAEETSDSGVPPISKLYAGEYISYMFKPVQIRMAVFIRPDSGGYDIYENIDF